MKKIGLGCFHFKSKTSISPEEYIDILKVDLDKINNISNLKFSNISDGWKSGFLPLDDYDLDKFNFENSKGYYPSFYSGKISFDIHIPKKAQEKVFDEGFAYKNNEDFKVEIYFNNIFTFTLVEPKNPTKEEGGALSIILVREFIKSELINTNNSKIELEMLGPTPFHADIDLELIDESVFNNKHAKNSTSKIVVDIIPTSGYDIIKIYGNIKQFKDENDFKRYVVKELSEEFSLFYLQALSENFKLTQWFDIESLIDNIKNNYSKKWWQPKRPASGILNKLFIKLIEFKQYNLLANKKLEETTNEMCRVKKNFFLKEIIKNEKRPISQKLIDNVSDFIYFTNNKQSSSISNYYVLFAGILGAILSAILLK